MTPATRSLDTPDFALLHDLVTRLQTAGTPDVAVREAVDVLTAAADPERADRLAIRAGEPPVLVERLAVWALKRVPPHVAGRAAAVLDAAASGPDTRGAVAAGIGLGVDVPPAAGLDHAHPSEEHGGGREGPRRPRQRGQLEVLLVPDDRGALVVEDDVEPGVPVGGVERKAGPEHAGEHLHDRGRDPVCSR